MLCVTCLNAVRLILSSYMDNGDRKTVDFSLVLLPLFTLKSL